MKQYGIIFVVLMLAFLGGCKKKPKAPSPETNKPKGQGSEKAPASASSDLQKLVQKAIDMKWLQGFYHPEVSGRKPLVILKNDFFKNPPKVEKFGQPVLFLSLSEIQKRKIPGYIEFTKLKIQKDSAHLEFRYSVEGVYGKVMFQKKENQWKITKQEGGER